MFRTRVQLLGLDCAIGLWKVCQDARRQQQNGPHALRQHHDRAAPADHAGLLVSWGPFASRESLEHDHSRALNFKEAPAVVLAFPADTAPERLRFLLRKNMICLVQFPSNSEAV